MHSLRRGANPGLALGGSCALGHTAPTGGLLKGGGTLVAAIGGEALSTAAVGGALQQGCGQAIDRMRGRCATGTALASTADKVAGKTAAPSPPCTARDTSSQAQPAGHPQALSARTTTQVPAGVRPQPSRHWRHTDGSMHHSHAPPPTHCKKGWKGRGQCVSCCAMGWGGVVHASTSRTP